MVPPPAKSVSFADLVWNLPLFDDLFLSMQGQNVMLVDFYIRDLEHDLLREYIDIERTPVPAALIVSALSQMWIFAVYELLRTWRQRVRDSKHEAQRPAPPASSGKAEKNSSASYRQRQLQCIRTGARYASELDKAYARVEPLFRRIEALRMNLAKHEVPKQKGKPALNPGYGRIDPTDGSIYWQVDLGDRVVDIVSRRSLADQLRSAVIGKRVAQASSKRCTRKT